MTKNKATLYFEVETPKNKGNKTLGADQGLLTCLSLSDGQVTKEDKDGWDLNKIVKRLSVRKKGSKGFRRTQIQRRNYINWSINQLNFDDVKFVKLEKVKNLRKGKKSNRRMSHWAYPLIKNKLVLLSEVKGFDLIDNENRFMSQRCSSCGWTHRSNRKGKTFKCTNTNCDFVTDSDLNAASNHEVELRELSTEEWQQRSNRTGFFWCELTFVGDECIVRHVT